MKIHPLFNEMHEIYVDKLLDLLLLMLEHKRFDDFSRHRINFAIEVMRNA